MPLDTVSETMHVYEWGILVGAALVAACLDLRTRRIPNALTLPLLLGGFVRAVWVAGPAGLVESVGAAAVVALPFVLLFLCGGGAGDAKLMAAIGAWVGLRQGLVVLACVGITGMVIAIVVARLRGRLGATLMNTWVWTYTFLIALVVGRKAYSMTRPPQTTQSRPDTKGGDMPYGVAIFVGTFISGVILQSWRS